MADKTPGLKDRVKRLVVMHTGGNSKEFARKAGVPYTTFKGIENGSEPSFATANRIAVAGGVSLEWLAGAEEKEESSSRYPIDHDDVAADISPSNVDDRGDQLLLSFWRNASEQKRMEVITLLATEQKGAGRGITNAGGKKTSHGGSS